MKQISSRSNPLYRSVQRLAAGKPPKGTHQLMIEGDHLCQAWLDHFGAPHLALFDAADPDLGGLRTQVMKLAPERCVILDPGLAAGLSQVAHGPGLYFVVEPPEPELPARVDHACIWLDRVQDPGNVGTLLRTAAAAGIGHAYLSAGCAQAWSHKALRSGQGAQFAMRIYERLDLQAATNDRLGVPLAVTTLDGAIPLYEADLGRPCAWIFGNEGQGVDPGLIARASLKITIPQADGVESLNVAAAAAICLFEQRRQQAGAGRQ
ncbi:MAG: RNA methyltransferase [Alcaligenaceae bacterium]|nr:RNA methyltransferase [Alcaligenaceae bacterium]